MNLYWNEMYLCVNKKSMRLYFLYFLFLYLPIICFSQPDPVIYYPDRIIEITEELETLDFKEDSIKYNSLLWERAEMQVSLRVRQNGLYDESVDTIISKLIINDLDYLIDQDVKIGEGKYQTTKLDFLLARGRYNNEITKYQNALADYFQIIDLDSAARFKEVSLYQVSITYFNMDSIDSSLFYVDQILEKRINSCEEGSSIVNWKITILEKSGRKEELVEFYRSLIRHSRKRFWYDNAKCFSERLKHLKRRK